MKRISVIAAVIALVIGCSPSHDLNIIGYRPTPVPIGTQYCSVAETHLSQLCSTDPSENLYCCQVVASTKKGKTFTQFCQETQNAGIALDPKCLSEVTSCLGIDKCVGTIR